jgi:hypothetical protein
MCFLDVRNRDLRFPRMLVQIVSSLQTFLGQPVDVTFSNQVVQYL